MSFENPRAKAAGLIYLSLATMDQNINYRSEKYSAIGPSVRAGKNDNAVMMKITAKIINPNVLESVRSVPALSGMNFLFAIKPAIAIGPMIGM